MADIIKRVVYEPKYTISTFDIVFHGTVFTVTHDTRSPMSMTIVEPNQPDMVNANRKKFYVELDWLEMNHKIWEIWKQDN